MVGIVAMLLILSIVVPFGAYFIGKKGAKSFKKTLLLNIISFFTVLVVGTVFMLSGTAMAAETSEVATSATGLGYLAAALVTGMSSIGAGIAVASSASAALGALSEDQTIMGKALIFVALAEGVALYGLLISFMILGNL